ncbi:MAG: tRNA (adenosine(37)-N6)-threonylcarbamoyltransferase complex dimerization subunit type 1 TsaB, partial [Eggerthellaceae bacterium]|nr:tRNA (adenosine(37)-N6)-threonylcarbamoyltransferase complex dimerization subunit type 1 TsaB [Eggerthellaceae bacterium]
MGDHRMNSEDKHPIKQYVLAFDTANERIAVGLGRINADKSLSFVCGIDKPAHRSSNTQLILTIDEVLDKAKVGKQEIACIACGKGPGSFTGVRIALATAKGMASALCLPLITISTIDAVAFGAQLAGVRGKLTVAADAMRHEVYPVDYILDDGGAIRQSADTVESLESFVGRIASQDTKITGDALSKYFDEISSAGCVLEKETWEPSAQGLIATLNRMIETNEADVFDGKRHDPGYALPVYTRLSDAEEGERARFAQKRSHETMSSTSVLNAPADEDGISYKPLDKEHAKDVAFLEELLMGSDAWNTEMVADEIGRKDRSWWAAYLQPDPLIDGKLVGYAGALIVDGDMQILKVAVSKGFQRKGIAAKLLSCVASDARDLGAKTASLEVRVSNEGAQSFYKSVGLAKEGVRPRYYSDGEDAVIMSGPLPYLTRDVAGMRYRSSALTSDVKKEHPAPYIFAIETSCDETAAAITDGNGNLIADVVASQIDFHARFGGVVPEIAGRKHIEAICGVCEECLRIAAINLGIEKLSWSDMDGIAVT